MQTHVIYYASYLLHLCEFLRKFVRCIVGVFNLIDTLITIMYTFGVTVR